MVLGLNRMNTNSMSLVDRLVGLVALRWISRTLTAVILLTALLLLSFYAYRSRSLDDLRTAWNMGLQPAVIIYTIGIYPLLYRRWELAIDALRPLTLRPDLLATTGAINQRGEWVSLLLGAVFAVWVTRSLPINGTGLMAYVLVSNVTMFGLMALAIYDSTARSRHLTRIVRAGLQLDLFDRRLLTPLARWGQSASLIFLGGTCLSLLFQSYETVHTVQFLVIFSIMIVVSLTLFFATVWNIHGALLAAQARELTIVRGHWNRARQELKRKLAEDGAVEVAKLYDPVVVLSAYESQVSAASTWPFSPKIARELAASLAAPILIYGLKIVMGLSGGA